MNQRHIHDDDNNNYSFQDINISNIKNNNKKDFGARKQYFRLMTVLTTILLVDVSIISI